MVPLLIRGVDFKLSSEYCIIFLVGRLYSDFNPKNEINSLHSRCNRIIVWFKIYVKEHYRCLC